MGKDAEYIKYIGKLMAGKGNVRPSGRRSFYRRRTKAEIIAIVKKCATLSYGQQQDFLAEIDARRSHLQYWRKRVQVWERGIE